MAVSVPATSVSPAAPGQQRRTFWRRTAAVLFGLLTALLLAELVLRVAGREILPRRLPLAYQLNTIDLIASGQSQYVYRSDVGWLNRPDFDRTIDDIRYHYNHQGLRADHEYAQKPGAGVKRISAYGDSFTDCDGVNLSDCWTTRLEELVPNTEILNFGVPGSAVDQSWLQYEGDGAAWKPCVVLIGHMVENINRVVNRFRPFYSPETGAFLPKPRFVLEDGRLVLLANPVRGLEDLRDPVWVESNLGPDDAWYFPGMFVASPFDWLEVISLGRTAAYRSQLHEHWDWNADYAWRMYRPGTEAFDLLVALLSAFANNVRADGATPVVMVYPLKTEMVAFRDTGAKPHAALLDALQRRDIPTIDFTDVFAEASRHAGWPQLIQGHYRPLGNSLVARTLASELPAYAGRTCGIV